MRIFLSHSHEDNDWCSAFVEELKRYGADIWYDKQSLYAGARWIQAIQTELEGRDTFLVVLTPNSWASEWVREEIDLALAQRKFIIGVLHKSTQISGFMTTRQMLHVIGLSSVDAAKSVAAALGLAVKPPIDPPRPLGGTPGKQGSGGQIVVPPSPPPTIRCSQGHINPAWVPYCDECGEPLPAPAPAFSAPMWSAPVAAPAPVTGLRAALIVESDNTTFDLTGKEEWLIGREDMISNIFPDVDLTPHGAEEGGVGRRHARISLSGGQCLIEDLNSIHFTFVNKQKIAPKTPTPLRDGDEIRLGRVVLRFRAI